MAAKRGLKLEARRARKKQSFKDRVPRQPDGESQGKHKAGFKGMKANEPCSCGGCHPNAIANKNKVVYL